MKLDKFKNLTGGIRTPDLPDNAYIKSLYDLPKKPRRIPILPIISTAAAAVILVTGVTLWALIGRGVRGTEQGDDIIVVTPADKTDTEDDKSESKKPEKEENKKPDGEQDDKDKQPPEDENTAPGDEDENGGEDGEDEDKPDKAPDDTDDTDESEPGGGGVTVTPDTPTAPDDGDVQDTKPLPQDAKALSSQLAEASKFTFQKSPLVNKHGSENRQVLPSFDIDGTSFVRDGTKLSDLKGKTIVFYTSSAPSWSYRDENNKTVSEFDWFKALKSELGLNVKFTLAGNGAASSSKAYMTSGKKLDVLYSTGRDLTEMLCMSRDITGLININDRGSSPGICKKTMDGYALAGGYRMIAPVGNVDVLWTSYGNSDAKTWRDGEWTYSAFGASGLSFTMEPSRAADAWACTKGYYMASVETGAPVVTVKSNWGQSAYLEHMKEVANILTKARASHISQSDMYCFEYKEFYKNVSYSNSSITATYEPITDHSDISAHGLRLRWMPYPKPDGETGAKYTAPSLGYGMMLPKSTVSPESVGAALKLCELWASRMTESILDNLSLIEYYGFSYDERKEYHDFCVESTVAPLYLHLDLGDSCRFYDALVPEDTDKRPKDLADEWAKTASIASQSIISKMK